MLTAGTALDPTPQLRTETAARYGSPAGSRA